MNNATLIAEIFALVHIVSSGIWMWTVIRMIDRQERELAERIEDLAAALKDQPKEESL